MTSDNMRKSMADILDEPAYQLSKEQTLLPLPTSLHE